jgi:NAD/NADP transhydrogenase beta subunit
MNRSLPNVILGGYGTTTSTKAKKVGDLSPNTRLFVL